MANHNKRKRQNEPMRTQSKYISNRRQARDITSDEARAVDFGFASDWLSRWRDFSKPIIERSKAKPPPHHTGSRGVQFDRTKHALN